ncbi:hypothetical protein OSTOST_07102 [Ostertagia ostertagi]
MMVELSCCQGSCEMGRIGEDSPEADGFQIRATHVERLFRQNVRSNRSKSLDYRNDRLSTRPVGGSSSTRQNRNKCRPMEDGELLQDAIPPGRLRYHEYFKSHAANFAIVLNLVITNLQDNFEHTCEALQTLGYQHVALKARGFQSMYWDIFTDCFERNRPVTFRREVEKEAWSRMILFILSQMKIGYHRGTNDRKIGRQSVPIIF